jgi:hypothetical protein
MEKTWSIPNPKLELVPETDITIQGEEDGNI